jgi:hypothetical protein
VGTQPVPADFSVELAKQIEAAGLSPYAPGLLSQVAEMQKQIDALNLLPPPAQGTVTAVTATAPVVSSGGTMPDISMPAANTTIDGYLTSTDWNTFNNKQPAGTYVTSISVVSTNGLAGTSSGGATPALTLSTSITGILKGNGTAISAAASGTDYAPATSGTSILYGNGSGGFSNVTIGTGVSFVTGTLSATGSGGTVTTVGFTGGIISVATPTTTPAFTVAGTSGGIPYFSSGTTWASSAALTQYGVVYGGGAGATPVATAAGTTGQVLTATTGGAPTWAAPATSGTVTAVSVVSANGFAGTSSGGATPALTLTTSITGLLYGNGTALAAATISAPLNYTAGTLSIPVATTSANGYLSSTDWTTFNNKGSGTVTSVAALTLGTSGTDLTSTVATGTTTPVITLNVPTASSTNRGALSSTDWSTFNNKQAVSAPVTKTADFTVAATDLWLINNKSGSTCTATLPAASSYSGRVLHFQNYQAQTLVSASSNVVPLAGGSAGTSILLASTGDSATLVSDGTNWLMTQYVPNNILLLE